MGLSEEPSLVEISVRTLFLSLFRRDHLTSHKILKNIFFMFLKGVCGEGSFCFSYLLFFRVFSLYQ